MLLQTQEQENKQQKAYKIFTILQKIPLLILTRATGLVSSQYQHIENVTFQSLFII